LRSEWSFSGGIFDLPKLRSRLEQLEHKSADPDLWNDPEQASTVLRERSQVEGSVRGYESLLEAVADLGVYLDMADAGDADAVAEFEKLVGSIDQRTGDLQVRLMLSGEYDANNAIVTIRPGAGGTESQDWAEILLRMYLRWAERKGFKTDILEIAAGEGAGIKTVTFTIDGPYAYGYIRAEMGIHRLVRISPFDNAGRRHTSFASVYAVPEIDDTIVVDIDEKDLRIDTYRSSGAGGQHVNKTDSAVRLTHIPSGIVVACQNERSQHKNKSTAMKILRARLYELEREKQEERMAKIGPEKREAKFGSQIRSYVLQPYQLVKDLRTGVEVGNVDAVLDGSIDEFIQAYLMKSSLEASTEAAAS
jgi:peptide chain release factor 2